VDKEGVRRSKMQAMLEEDTGMEEDRKTLSKKVRVESGIMATPPNQTDKKMMREKQEVGGVSGPLREPAIKGLALPPSILHHVVEILGTPPNVNHNGPNIGPDPAGQRVTVQTAWFLSDLTSMACVNHQWKDVVRSSPIWKLVCRWRYPAMVASHPGQADLHDVVQIDPRKSLVRSGNKQKSSSLKWLELCMHMGRSLSKEGAGRMTAEIWSQDYVMLVDVHAMIDGKLRLLCGASHLKLVMVNNNGDGESTWRAVSGSSTSTEWSGGYYRWPLEIILDGDPVDKLCEVPLTVEIMLVNKRNGEMALWHKADKELYNKEDPNDPGVSSDQAQA